MIAQIVVFAQSKKNFEFRSTKIVQKCCEWKSYLGSSLKQLMIVSFINLLYLNIQNLENYLWCQMLFIIQIKHTIEIMYLHKV